MRSFETLAGWLRDLHGQKPEAGAGEEGEGRGEKAGGGVDSDMTISICSNCGLPDEQSDSEHRAPCQNCGSLKREFQQTVSINAKVNSFIFGHARNGPKTGRRYAREIYFGDSYSKAGGRWSVIHRVIDRTANWYYELITDKESGEILREVAEPLSAHEGHGSAQAKRT